MTSLHVKLNSYLELSIKSGGKVRRAGGVECVDVNELSSEIQIPKQLEIFGHRQLTNPICSNLVLVWLLQHQSSASCMFSGVDLTQMNESAALISALTAFHRYFRTKYIGLSC